MTEVTHKEIDLVGFESPRSEVGATSNHLSVETGITENTPPGGEN